MEQRKVFFIILRECQKDFVLLPQITKQNKLTIMSRTKLSLNLMCCLFSFLLLVATPASAQHDDYNNSFSIGYINKDWVTDFSGESYHENLFGEEGKRLHGVQLGYRYTTCLPVGLGLQTGLSYEWCMSYSDKVKDNGFDRFNEHSLHLPIHALYRIPLAQKASISPYAGVGFNWKVSANMKSGEYTGIYDDYNYGYGSYWHDRWYGDYTTVSYGKNGWPRALNAQLEFGANIRISDVVVGVTYSRGLTNHKFYKSDKTRQDKLAITIGVCID